MRGKLVLATGIAVGYVLGSRAGRGRYEQIAKAASNLWSSDAVQHQVHNAQDLAKDKAPDVVDFVSGNVKKVVGKGKKSDSSAIGTSATDPAN